jgi:hypothetical protein
VKGVAGKGLVYGSALGAINQAAEEDSTKKYATRFNLNEPTGDGSAADIAKFMGLRALGFMSDLGDNMTLGLAGRFYRDKQATAPAGAQPQPQRQTAPAGKQPAGAPQKAPAAQSVPFTAPDRYAPGSREALLDTLRERTALLMNNPSFARMTPSALERDHQVAQTNQIANNDALARYQAAVNPNIELMKRAQAMYSSGMSSFGDLDAAGAFAGADEAATAAKKAAHLKHILSMKEEGDAYASRINKLNYGLYGDDGVERKAEGGMIGAMGPQGSPQQNPIAARYGQYIQSAMQAGVQPLPLEKFTDLLMRTQMQLQQAPAQAPMGYAEGGAVDVDGKLVLGPGTGKSDSIPAVIDGERPAALSTGEFVMPIEAVKFFGLQRLNKMVEAARKGQQGGDTGGDAYAKGGVVKDKPTAPAGMDAMTGYDVRKHRYGPDGMYFDQRAAYPLQAEPPEKTFAQKTGDAVYRALPRWGVPE